MRIMEKLNEYCVGGKEFVLVTVVEATGSSPARSGFKMIVDKNNIFGSVGGGSLEYLAVDAARELFGTRKNLLKEFNLSAIGMTCGGTVKLFFEYMPGGKNFFIFGYRQKY